MRKKRVTRREVLKTAGTITASAVGANMALARGARESADRSGNGGAHRAHGRPERPAALDP
jgi:hypothetical protein